MAHLSMLVRSRLLSNAFVNEWKSLVRQWEWLITFNCNLRTCAFLDVLHKLHKSLWWFVNDNGRSLLLRHKNPAHEDRRQPYWFKQIRLFNEQNVICRTWNIENRRESEAADSHNWAIWLKNGKIHILESFLILQTNKILSSHNI